MQDSGLHSLYVSNRAWDSRLKFIVAGLAGSHGHIL